MTTQWNREESMNDTKRFSPEPMMAAGRKPLQDPPVEESQDMDSDESLDTEFDEEEDDSL